MKTPQVEAIPGMTPLGIKPNITPDVDKLILEMAAELKPAVEIIENDKIPTTKDHYGRYMGIISAGSKGNKQVAQILVLALLAAGANKSGVSAAFRICFP